MSQFHLISKYIATIYRKSKNDFNQQITHLDVRATQSDILLFIYEHPNFLQKQIAEQMAIDPSLLTRDLRTLEEKDLLLRIADQTDGRAKRIVLTEQGVQLAQRLQQIMDQWWQDFFQKMPELTPEEVMSKLEKVYLHLTEDETSD
ncbi:MarR family transcriptional regulator [Enterococcus faecalis]|uniref:MarR family winged helix-turn-helix transcriptional regulator n=1 Tax=Enterococcus faecalis TaxID=1351 RepID=UPI0015746874|nr:MarR family transcriptional regulator [Enterococcus faecalis]EGO2851467.1 MarR family transcriptional regulator [Enterococcus faecalis]EGO6085508.1 MarR family transcriptional regulator [Enterococcus faecalis]EGO9277687.1 MarR family transcriptional regulator [Enterococcus faecalis]EHV0179248.1 MarR family transcriptional regulator [Enterococcus faecalis]EIP8073138.1 MarR family transcriptional regulator [Enterococcus faecalis]